MTQKLNIPPSEMGYKRKLSEDDVRTIRATYKQGKWGQGYSKLARKYGVSPGTIKKIVTYVTYKHVEG